MERIFVGIDVAKDRLDVHVRPSGEAFAVARDGKGLEELADRLGGLDASLVVLEATGGYEVTLAAALCAAAQYTLIGTAKLNDVDSQAWLADVLDRVADLPQTRLHELLPWHWKAERQQALAA